jgi:Bacterial regulatory proteins, gntR family
MIEYLDVATDLARRVRTGEWRAGAELWSVREHATRRGVTASTINRAYRCLAENKVIVLEQRRRARVAADGALAAARFLEPERVFRLAGSDDPALRIVLDHVGHHVMTVGARGSFPGVRALARGDADGAAIHLLHRDGTLQRPVRPSAAAWGWPDSDPSLAPRARAPRPTGQPNTDHRASGPARLPGRETRTRYRYPSAARPAARRRWHPT